MSINKHITACGGTITIPAPVKKKLQASPHVLHHLQEAIGKISLPRDKTTIEREVKVTCVFSADGAEMDGWMDQEATHDASSTMVVIIAKPTGTLGRYQLVDARVNDNSAKRAKLQLVHGGAIFGEQSAEPVLRSVPSSQTPTSAQVEKLRNAILHREVEELGLTIDEVLRELNEKLNSSDTQDFARCSDLKQSLREYGLMHRIAPPHLNLDNEGYLQLYKVEGLVARFPEVAELRPEDHALLTIGVLPPSQRSRAWLNRHIHHHLVLRAFAAQQSRSKGWFDAPDHTAWGRESNLLRHAILSLHLSDVGCSVDEALTELCNSLTASTSDELERTDDLKRGLEALGIRFRDDTQKCGYPFPGYLSLDYPDRLLREHPGLAVLHPLSWQSLQIQ